MKTKEALNSILNYIKKDKKLSKLYEEKDINSLVINIEFVDDIKLNIEHHVEKITLGEIEHHVEKITLGEIIESFRSEES